MKQYVKLFEEFLKEEKDKFSIIGNNLDYKKFTAMKELEENTEKLKKNKLDARVPKGVEDTIGLTK